MASRKKPRHLEDDEQRALVQWARYHPELKRTLYANANGGKRSKTEAARLIGLGVIGGVCDLTLMKARGGYFGLYIEMKKQRQHFKSMREAERAVSDKQHRFIQDARNEGYQAEVCYGFMETKKIITEYLLQPPTRLIVSNSCVNVGTPGHIDFGGG